MARAGGKKVFLLLSGKWMESRRKDTYAGLAGVFPKLDDKS